MDFKQKIEQHKLGKYDLATELISMGAKVEYELTFQLVTKYMYSYMEPKRKAKAEVAEDYIAIYINALQQRYAKYVYKKYLSNIERAHDGMKATDYIYYYLSQVGEYYHVDDFDKIPDKVLKQVEHDEFYECFNDILRVLPHVKMEKAKKIAETVEPLKRVLNEIIPKVDTTKTDKEIVKYINHGINKKIYREIAKATGTREFNIDGERYFINPNDMKLLKNQTNFRKIFKFDFLNLSERQKEFTNELLNHLQQALDSKQTDVFTFNQNGEIIDFNKRHFARLMELEESNFKKRLKRVQDKYQSWK